MKRLPMLFHLALAALLIAGLTPLAAAQSNRGNISGSVVDPTGAVVPNAKITARNVATGITQETESTSEGVYRFSELPAGVYTLTATAQGFK
nr:carboxypeptidase regulatory-like domain-containing protein [Pyrinomonadaceae bacterium]